MCLSRNAYNTQKHKFAGDITEEGVEKQLKEIQKELDKMMYKLYGLNLS